jgi:hypothetical protein
MQKKNRYETIDDVLFINLFIDQFLQYCKIAARLHLRF